MNINNYLCEFCFEYMVWLSFGGSFKSLYLDCFQNP